jgi:DNA (cytosine-5)-methyltransferase 1
MPFPFTYATLFTGGDLFGVGAEAAGLSPTWGVEIDGEIAEVGRKATAAGILPAAVEDVDFAKLAAPWLLHASPVCTRASVMQQSAAETDVDIAAARATVRAFETFRPEVFTLENVIRYRKFEAFRIITRAVLAAGYHLRAWNLNAADYGTPQTRRRLIVVASRSFVPRRPSNTHTARRDGGGQLAFFDSLQLQPWRGWYGAAEDLLPRLPADALHKWQTGKLPAYVTDPAANPAPSDVDARGFLVCGYGNEFKAEDGGRVTFVHASEPSFTILASTFKQIPRAALASGTVLKTTPRVWARLQGLPDSYPLPANNVLASKIIGNGVPPPLAEAICRSALQQFNP